MWHYTNYVFKHNIKHLTFSFCLRMKAIVTIFKIRKFSLLTPLSPDKQKITYVYFLFILHTVGTTRSSYYKFERFRRRNIMHKTLRLISYMNLYFSIIYPIIRVKKISRDWCNLLKNVSQISYSPTTNNVKISFIIVWFILFWISVGCVYYAYILSVGLSFFKLYFFETLQIYSHFFWNYHSNYFVANIFTVLPTTENLHQIVHIIQLIQIYVKIFRF